MFLENEEFVRLKSLEAQIEQLRRAFLKEKYSLGDEVFYIIFGWEKGEQKIIPVSTSPAIVPAPEPVPAFIKKNTAEAKPMTSKKSEMMKKVKDLRVNHSMSGKQIAEKTGLSEATVSTYLKEMGLRNESSMTEISGPVRGGGRV